ncbi:conserved hypothetical protein [Anaeromyxobacter sp. K]|uniref:glycosyltransferase family 39 protein n=1 Tax=Anaeromyxobacter sp. (strain K) TaxID=447217 RepID=UPI00015F84FD|nr:glycosyltransferase family 39 protein [Anaeromyxobacter sp. K]ACG71649.1 conserved hypothetical protein [Anaeromyxobacter sp. K]
MDPTQRARRPLVDAPRALAALAFALHAACGGRYGIFRDELYFVACGRRLAAGYVDQPPGIAVVARLASELFGTWVPGLRLPAWLASAATVLLAGRLAARLGAGAAGAALASAATLACGVLLALGHYLTMNAFEPLLVLALALLLVRLADGGDPRLWVAAGAVAGLAALFKYTSALVALALLAGVAATSARRALRTRWALAGAAVGLLAVLPNLAWQLAHGLPFLELVRNGQLHKNAPTSPSAFALALLRDANPLLAPLWLGGLGWLVGRPGAPGARALGIGAALYLALLAATGGKPYYAAPVLPLLLAAGGAAAARLLRRPALRLAAPALTVLSVAPALPLALPLLPEPAFVRWQAALGVEPERMERTTYGVLPQIFADQHGWRELVRGVGEAAATLAPAERATAAVFGQNYGEAAAVDVYGADLGLPPAISGHNQYWLWGVPPGRGDPILVISDADEDCGGAFRERVLAARLPSSPWVMPYEDARWIWICRGLRRPLAGLWPALRSYQ